MTRAVAAIVPPFTTRGCRHVNPAEGLVRFGWESRHDRRQRFVSPSGLRDPTRSKYPIPSWARFPASAKIAP